MTGELWLLLSGLFLYTLPLFYLERHVRKSNSPIKKGNHLSQAYKMADAAFIIAWLVTSAILVLTEEIDNVFYTFIVFIALDMLKIGSYAVTTGKYPMRTRGGMEYFYVDYSELLFRQNMPTFRRKLTVKFLGKTMILFAVLYGLGITYFIWRM